MKNALHITKITILAALISGCGEKSKTEEWYLAHPEELKKASENCKLKTFEELIQDKHCMAVEAARQKAWREQQKNAPLPKFNIKDFE